MQGLPHFPYMPDDIRYPEGSKPGRHEVKFVYQADNCLATKVVRYLYYQDKPNRSVTTYYTPLLPGKKLSYHKLLEVLEQAGALPEREFKERVRVRGRPLAPLISSAPVLLPTPEYQEPGTCRVCGKPLTGRQRAFCSTFKKDEYGNLRWPEEGTPCSYLWSVRFASLHWRKRHCLAQADYHCAKCGKHSTSPLVEDGPVQPDPEGMELDHIIPLSWGGTDDFDNLQILCSVCHAEKTASQAKRG